jgi:hypothetical protein
VLSAEERRREWVCSDEKVESGVGEIVVLNPWWGIWVRSVGLFFGEGDG